MTELLSQDQINVFWAIADVLLPPSGSAPALREVDAELAWFERVAAARADLVPRLQVVLAGMDPDRLEAQLRIMFDNDRVDFEVLAVFVAGTYYLIPEVRTVIGYPGQLRLPPSQDEAIDQLEDLIDQASSHQWIFRTIPS